MALNSNDLKSKIISDLRSVSDSFKSEMDTYKSDVSKYRDGTLSEMPRAPAIPDYIKCMSDSISSYLTEYMELQVTWVALSPYSVPDPLITFNAKVSEVNLGMKKSDVLNISDPDTFNSTINAKYKFGIASIEIAPSQTVSDPIPTINLTSVTLGASPINASIKFGDKSNSGIDAFDKNMKVLADSIVNGLVGPITPIPLSGTHGIYESLGTSSIIGIL